MSALDERYGRAAPPVAGFIGRAAVCGVGCALLVVLAVAIPSGSEWFAGILFVGAMLAAPAGGAIATLAAVVGAAAERGGRTPALRGVRLALAGGAAVTMQCLLLLLGAGGGVLLSYWPGAVAAGIVGALLLLRLRHRTFRDALRIRGTPSA